MFASHFAITLTPQRGITATQEQTTILTVEGMSCAHCVKAITQSVGALDGVENVMVTLDEKTVAVTYDAAKISVEQVRQEIEDQGFDCTT